MKNIVTAEKVEKHSFPPRGHPHSHIRVSFVNRLRQGPPPPFLYLLVSPLTHTTMPNLPL